MKRLDPIESARLEPVRRLLPAPTFDALFRAASAEDLPVEALLRRIVETRLREQGWLRTGP